MSASGILGNTYLSDMLESLSILNSKKQETSEAALRRREMMRKSAQRLANATSQEMVIVRSLICENEFICSVDLYRKNASSYELQETFKPTYND